MKIPSRCSFFPFSAFRFQRFSSAFTLIELLTVIAIIGILAGVILGVLGGVRKKARAAVCVSNLRQCGVALNLFANDNKGEFPAAMEMALMSWPVRLARDGYLPRLEKNNDAINAPSVAVCPSSKSQGRFEGENAYRRVYGMWNGNADYGRFQFEGDVKCFRLSVQSLETNRIIVADSGRCVYSEGWDPSYFIMKGTGVRETTAANKVINLAHGEKANALFVDGHVKAVDAAWLKNDGRYNWTSY